MYSPVIVVGPGRCGTSVVARFVRDCGVFMGERFCEPNADNPEGYCEDLDFRDFNEARLADSINRFQWARGIERLIIDRRVRAVPWGFKDPRVAEFAREYFDYFPRALWVRCYRPEADVIASFVRCYGLTAEDARKAVRTRNANLDLHLRNAHVVEIAITAWGEDTQAMLRGHIEAFIRAQAPRSD